MGGCFPFFGSSNKNGGNRVKEVVKKESLKEGSVAQSHHMNRVSSGIGTEKANEWAFDTSQFDSILKRLKVKICQQSAVVNKNEEDKEDKEDKVEADAVSKSYDADKQEKVVKLTRPQGR